MRGSGVRYEMAAGAGGDTSHEPAWAAGLRALRRASLKPGESIILDARAGSVQRVTSPAMRATLDRQRRTRALDAELAREEAERGIVGLAVPLGEPTRIRPGHWEVFARGAFGESVVPLRRQHGGATLGSARTFELPHGLYFEAVDVRHPEAVLRGADKVSISFQRDTIEYTEEPYEGGTLRRIHQARLTEIALVSTPVYRSTWAARRGTDAWRRVYGRTMSDLRDIARGTA